MKRTTLLIIVGVVALLVAYGVSTYNSLAKASQEVASAWSNVETQYQRRSDLIPNLVNTVKGYAAHEEQTLQSVVEARAAATSVTVDGANMTAEQFAQYVDAQGKVTSALGRLIAVAESYPELKANQNFLELQAQLEGTENRIAVERQRYNEVVKSFNQRVVTFPNNIVASMFGFGAKEFFAAQQGAETAPVVEF
ncbi:MAG: LemA family protein [Alistipes sp.]|nr:LemA family protein [Alistipes sp.]